MAQKSMIVNSKNEESVSFAPTYWLINEYIDMEHDLIYVPPSTTTLTTSARAKRGTPLTVTPD